MSRRMLFSAFSFFAMLASVGESTLGDEPYYVYENSKDPIQYYYAPGAGAIVSDDMQLAVEGGCRLDSYSLLVYAPQGGPYDVQVSLWSDDPCAETSSLIEGSAAAFLAVPPSEETPYLLAAAFDPPIELPNLVYMQVAFSTDQAGWIIANQAELGATLDQFWLDEPLFNRCGYYWWCCGGDPYAGFWASITCGVLGDFDGDREVDLGDVPGFVSAMMDLDPAGAGRADMNGDGAADGADIPSFVETILGA